MRYSVECVARKWFSVPSRVGVAVVLGIAAVEFAVLLLLNDGCFFYTLDDPYIHLALAEQVAQGHYGINAAEYSAPSSSIIWTFLLAPFSGLRSFALVPLIYNLIISVFTVLLFGRFALLVTGKNERRASVYTVLLILCSNIIGLAFTGMEHSLQLLCTILTLYGLFREYRTGKVGWYLYCCIVLAPLVRYEGAAVTIAAVLYLVGRRHYTGALIAGAGAGGALVAFSLFLIRMGLPPFPTSVLAKSTVVAGSGQVITLLHAVATTVLDAVTSTRGLLLAGAGAALLVKWCTVAQSTGERLLYRSSAFAVLLHCAMGRYGSYNRYEAAIWTWALLTLLYAYRRELSRLISGGKMRCIGAVLLLLLVCAPYCKALFTLPLASNNIYQQHFQMRRFVVDYYKKSVAVNDIGLVSYRTPHYILDYAGLASASALACMQLGECGDNWMDSLAVEHGVRLAMIYREWFEVLPAAWINIGELHLGNRRITPAGSVVTFYAMDGRTADELKPLIDDFVKTLPDGVRFCLPEQDCGAQ